MPAVDEAYDPTGAAVVPRTIGVEPVELNSPPVRLRGLLRLLLGPGHRAMIPRLPPLAVLPLAVVLLLVMRGLILAGLMPHALLYLLRRPLHLHLRLLRELPVLPPLTLTLTQTLRLDSMPPNGRYRRCVLSEELVRRALVLLLALVAPVRRS